jgi:hypothetical protein
MGRQLLAAVAIAAAGMTGTVACAAAERATPAEAEAMVRKGVAYMKANGRDKGLAEISNNKGAFVDRDLYLTVTNMQGVNVAHGVNPKMVGKNLIDMRDSDGKEYLRERIQLAQTKGAFWQDYKFTDPITHKIQPKQMYCERLDDLVVCGGVYRTQR